ncbi:unnamed protein product, partial [Bubo scandiacus]
CPPVEGKKQIGAVGGPWGGCWGRSSPSGLLGDGCPPAARLIPPGKAAGIHWEKNLALRNGPLPCPSSSDNSPCPPSASGLRLLQGRRFGGRRCPVVTRPPPEGPACLSQPVLPGILPAMASTS